MKNAMCGIVVLCSVLALSCGGRSDADNSPKNAKVVFSVGDVKVEKSGKAVIAQADMEIADGSLIVTGNKSQCNLLLGTDSYISIKEKTRMKIDSIVKSVSGKESSSVDLKVGRIVINPKKLLKDEEFRVKTPTAVAAVRGTKFVVAQEEGVAAKISVVEGKVELKPRVESIESQNLSPEEAVIAKEIQKTIDDKAMIIEANQSATIDSKSVEKLNKTVSDAIQEMKAVVPAASGDKDKKENTAAVQVVIPDVAIRKIVSNIDISKKLRIDEKDAGEVRELDRVIDEDKTRRKDEDAGNASVTIVTPIAYSQITVDGKNVGQGSVSLKVKSGVPVSISVKAKDFDKYESSVTLGEKESKMIEVALVRSKLRDRLGWSGPVGSVKGDVIFYNDMIIVSTSSGAIVSMTKSGDTVWRSQLAGGLDSTPAISGANLFAVTKSEMLYSLNAVTGKVQWTSKISGSVLFGAAPRVINDSVIIAASGGKIYSFSMDGTQKWVSDIHSGIYSSPSFGAGKILIGAEDQQLYAFSLQDGSVAWKVSLDGRVVSSAPLVSGGNVIVGTYKGSVYSFEINKGTQSWVYKTGGAIVSSPVEKDGLVYIGSRDCNLYAIEASTGSVKWTFKTDKPVVADVAYNDKELYVGSGSIMYSLNPGSGSLIWSYAMPEQIVSIVADSDQIYVGSGRSMSALRMDLRDVVK
ncbi:MAG TPA: PQQ-binding-like beta-propeller repeat protein [Spirochaetota bacterium]|nr:PQQ-binding-like beta-propeller repeat protein [Spirochaetota bacterium]